MTISESLINLDVLPSLLAACLVIMLGTFLSQRVALLSRYSIPSPVIGGILFAIGAAILVRTSGKGIALAAAAKSDLLLLFFASLGLTSDLGLLVRGGPRLLRFLLALIPFLLAQDALGVAVAKLLGLHPFLGLIAGSITLVGGHGTGAAYVGKFGEAADIPGVMALTMTSATLGLVLGGIVGGPVAERLIRRYRLSALPGSAEASDVIIGPIRTPVTSVSVIGSLTVALIAVLIGRWLEPLPLAPAHGSGCSSLFPRASSPVRVQTRTESALPALLADAPVTVPDFLLCLLTGLTLRNVGGVMAGLVRHPRLYSYKQKTWMPALALNVRRSADRDSR